MLRGVASAADFGALTAALASSQVATERGGCGGPTADGPVAFEVTWYGQGARFNSFKVGANLDGCSPRLQSLLETVLRLINDVRPAPGTQAFPRGLPRS
jgi:hypothetical protein